MLVDGLKLLENSSITNLVVDSGTTFPTSPEAAELFFYTSTTDSLNPAGLYYSDGTNWNQIVSQAILTTAFDTVSVTSNFTMGSNATAGSNAAVSGGSGPFPTSPAPVEGQFFYYSNSSDSVNQKGLYVYDTTAKWTLCGSPSASLPTSGELAWLSSVSAIPASTVAYISNLTSDAQFQLNSITSSLSSYATLASPTFTGTVIAPTVGSTDNTNKVATTAFVQSAIAGVAGGMTYQGTWNASTNVAPTLADGTGTKGQFYIVDVAGSTSFVTATGTVNSWNVGDLIVYDGAYWDKVDGIPSEVTSVAGRIGAVTLTTSDIGGMSSYALLASPALTGTPLAPTATSGTSTTQIATTAFVSSAIAGFSVTPAWSAITSVPTILSSVGALSAGSAGHLQVSSIGVVSVDTVAYAPLASPALTGTPTAPTATSGTSNTEIATTAFVTTAVSSVSSSLSGYATLLSPDFTGTPLAPTPGSSDNSTKIATTAYVTTAISNLGSSLSYTLESVTTAGNTTDKAIAITNTTSSSDTTHGALIVSGGVGVGGALHAANLYSVSELFAGSVINAGYNSGNTPGTMATNNPAAFYIAPSTFNDNTSTAGTYAHATIAALSANALTSTNAITYTNASSLYIDGAPYASGGNVTLGSTYSLYVNAGNAHFGGTTTGLTPTSGDSSTKFATTAYVQSALGGYSATPAWSTITGTPTTLAGYGVTSVPYSDLTGVPSTVAWSTITGTPSTLAAYGISTVPYSDLTGIPSLLSSFTGLSLSITGNLKITNGVASIDTTAYATTASLSGYVSTSVLGQPSGVATLNSSGVLTSSQIPSTLLGVVSYIGIWNASTNTPTLPAASSANKGEYYVVSTSGTTSVTTVSGVVSQWNVGDVIISDGTYWDKINGISNEVLSVAGKVGTITLTTTDIGGMSSYATLLSPDFTGTPLAPTPSLGDSSTKIATTAFVANAIVSSTSGTLQVVTNNGATTSNAISITNSTVASSASTGALIVTGGIGISGVSYFGSSVHGVTEISSDSSTKFATTAFVTSALGGYSATPAWSTITGTPTTLSGYGVTSVPYSDLTGVPSTLAGYGITVVPWSTITSTPTTLSGYGITNGVTSSSLSSTLSGYLTASAISTTYAPLASPTFTGTPSGPTATSGTSTTQFATTAFVTSALGGYSATPTWSSITSVPTILSSVGALATGTAGHLQVSALGVVSVDTTSYLSTSTASSTYATISSLSSYLTTSTASTTYAPIASPTFTGTPSAPTPTSSDSSTKIATTAFVQTALASVAGGMTFQGTWNASTNVAPTLADGTGTKGQYYVVSVAGTTAITTISGVVSSWQVGDIIVYDGTDWDKINGASTEVTSVAGRIGAVTLSTSDISGISSYAVLASPTFTGTPLAPTATSGTSTTQIATTAFVTSALSSIPYSAITGAPTTLAFSSITSVPTILSSVSGLATGTAGHLQVNTLGVVTVDTTSYLSTSTASTTYAPIASPTFTGTPIAPTATSGTSTTQIATTAFVTSAVSASSASWSSLTGTAVSVPLSAGEIATATVTTSSTTATPIVSLPIATYRGFKATISVTYATTPAYQMTEILVLHDGTNTNLVEYGEVLLPITDTASTLTTFSATISGGNVQLVATSVNAGATKYQVVFTAINI